MDVQASVGINIEHNRVSLVYLKRSLKGFSLGGYESHPLEKTDPEEKASEVGRLVNGFLNTRKILSADIFLGIPRNSTIVRYIELPLAVKENLRGTLLYEMEKYVPLAVSEIYFDFQIISEDKTAGRLTVLLIAVKKQLIDPYLDNENRLGTGISGVEIGTTALVNFFSRGSGAPDADTYAVLSVKDEYIELGLVSNKLLNYSKYVTMAKGGGEGLRVITEELELLRKTLGPEPQRLEVVSCGANGNIAEQFKDREDIHVGLPDLSGTGLPGDDLGPAYGLALKGIRKMPMDINLLPPDSRKKVSKLPYYSMVVLAGVLVLSLLGWAGSNMMHQRYVAHRLEKELHQLETQVAAVNKTRGKIAALEKQVDALNELRQRDVPVLNILLQLTEEMSQDVWFNRLDIAEDKGTMDGYADSASALIPLLAESSLLKDVAFLSPITKDKDGKDRFRIGFSLR